MTETDNPHEVVCTRNLRGDEVHYCVRCGYVGSTAPPIPCPVPEPPASSGAAAVEALRTVEEGR